MKPFSAGIYLLSIILIPIKSYALTIEDAVDLAHAADPALQAARADVKSAEAEAVLSSRWENPELEFEAEGIGGDRESGTAEYTAFISQSIPAFGRTRQSRQVADESTRAAQYMLMVAAMETEAAVRATYADVHAAGELARIAGDYQNIAKDAVDASRRKNEAGAIPDRDVLQAEMELEKAGLDKALAITEVNLAEERMSALLGRAVKEADMATDFYSLPNMDIPDAMPNKHPALKMLNAKIAAAETERKLAASSSISDITFGAGIRYEEESEENSYLFGLAIPLPLYTRGSHASAPALGQVEALKARREKERIELNTSYREAVASYHRARMAAELHKTRLLPGAVKVYQQSKEAYDVGSLSWLELLESQQLLIKTRVGYVDAVRDVHVAAAELGKFIAKTVED